MEAFAIRDLREHTGELVRNAESGALSLVSKHGKPLFIAVPFSEKLLGAGVGVAYADRLVQSGELSVAAGAKIAGMPYARYLQHLGAIGYSMLDESADLTAELALLMPLKRNKSASALKKPNL